ncbi:helix-turn-helix transcriptional regulator [Brevibacterium album]|uniref:helix-turn-helix transcriptional regulator n=1 Tax=Brevibacterium album TaxID=417948 RepID=UPI000A0721E5|nr:LuxR C-terminal-related transcriptional regulator [Brevibacterium album]
MRKLVVLGPWPQAYAWDRAALAATGLGAEVAAADSCERIPPEAAALLIDADGSRAALDELSALGAANLPPLILAAARPEDVPDGAGGFAAALIGMPLDVPELLSAFHAVSVPGTYLSRNLIARRLAAAGGAESLTARESEVIGLVADGASDSAIAQTLFIEESTVRSHLRSLRRKLGADNRAHAVALAGRYGLLPAVRAERAGLAYFG